MAKLLLAGCGKMGSAMLAGWLENPYQKSDIVVIEPNGEIAQNIASRFGVATVARPD
ncbi:MAG TPA: pyrroline-5-carboxylate reductase, partial [Rhodospirillales bacterium]|nr:pyrroline-5-carboxylate reductase [Rhodospirillales bacterium]